MAEQQQDAFAWFHGYVGTCVAEHDVDRRMPPVDPDGDYVVTWGGSPLYVTAVDAAVRTARVWAVAASGLQSRVALLREINDLNLEMPLVTVVLSRWGSVLVSSFLVAEAVNPAAMAHAVDAVGSCAEHVGVLLAGVHGGQDAFATTRSA
ncbi:MAG: YbjN domain-containing protein [Nocardioidaceae bacterium]|nr:YbjN domain-containing protein [Nocardioidaceae bacterium]